MPSNKAKIKHDSQLGVRVYYYHTDHLGTPQELTNCKGEVVWLGYQRAWGGLFENRCFTKNLDNLEISAELLQPIRFQGQFFDEETHLHYNRFRYYDYDVGMFIQRDPIGLMGGNNVFQYAPNPVQWIDPFGLDVIVIHNGSTFGNNGKVNNPLGHTAIAVEGYGLYSFGNASDDNKPPVSVGTSINNNVLGGNLEKYIRREAPKRNTRFTIIKTTPQQDLRIVEALKKDTSYVGLINTCASRVVSGLNELKKDMSFFDTILLPESVILPLDAENLAINYMNHFGGY